MDKRPLAQSPSSPPTPAAFIAASECPSPATSVPVEDVVNGFVARFADFLRNERRKRGLSQAQLATLLHSHQSFIGRLEQPLRNGDAPSLRTMIAVIVALGRVPHFFAWETEASESESRPGPPQGRG